MGHFPKSVNELKEIISTHNADSVDDLFTFGEFRLVD